MVERMTLNHVVVGSIPTVGAYICIFFFFWSFIYIFIFINIIFYYNKNKKISVGSSMVRIRAFQARGPGSIPGQRIYKYIF